LAPDLVLILGIWLSWRGRNGRPAGPRPPLWVLGESSVARDELNSTATAALSAGRRKAGVMAERMVLGKSVLRADRWDWLAPQIAL